MHVLVECMHVMCLVAGRWVVRWYSMGGRGGTGRRAWHAKTVLLLLKTRFQGPAHLLEEAGVTSATLKRILVRRDSVVGVLS